MNFRRERRGMLNQGLGFGTLGYTIANYNTEAVSDKKLNLNFDDEMFNKINCIPDPLRKNLADTVITNEKPEKMPPDPSDFIYPQEFNQEPSENPRNRTDNIYSSLQGISSFFSNFFGAITGTVFQRRAKSPVTEYFDCFDHNTGYNNEMAPPAHWQDSKKHDQNKNLAPEQISCDSNDNMSSYMATVAQCEQKLTAVKSLLLSQHVVPQNKLRRRPKKVFVEPGAIQQSTEGDFATDSYVSLPNSDYIEYISVINNHNGDTAAIDGPKVKIEPEIKSGSDLIETEIVTTLPESQIVESDASTSKIDSIATIFTAEGKEATVRKSNLNMPEAQITADSDVFEDIETSPINDKLKNKSPAEITNETEEKSTVVVGLDLNEAQNIIEKSIENNKLPVIYQVPDAATLVPEIKIAQSEKITNKSDLPSICQSENQPSKEEIISSVEDKMAKLKLMLQEKRTKSSQHSNSTDCVQNSDECIEKVNTTRSQQSMKLPIDKVYDKRFKNPHRLTEKRRSSKIKADIQEDMRFAHEIDSSDISSVENSPKVRNSLKIPNPKRSLRKNCLALSKSDSSSDISRSPATEYFDELKGRFHSSSTTESEDSFQIVFADSPKRCRRTSDCESEDSFIVFDDSPDSCYTSNDVFGERQTESESNYSDSDTDLSDSGCDIEKLKLSQHLSRTVSDLTDDSLYKDTKSMDEIDFAVRTFDELPDKDICDDHANSKRNSHKIAAPNKINLESDLKSEIKNKAKLDNQNEVIINQIGNQSNNQKSTVSQDSVSCVQESDKENQSRKKLMKRVQFSAAPPKVHVLRVWTYASRQARAGHWERLALDRERFKRRIADVEMAISWVLKPQHRSRVMFQRFMPWWNQMKRLEAAEKKRLKAEEEKRKKEEEEQRIREEAERRIEEEYEEEQLRILEEERIIQEELERQAKEDAEKAAEEQKTEEPKEYAFDLDAQQSENEMETSSSYPTHIRGKETTVDANFALAEKMAGEKGEIAEKMAAQNKRCSKREYSKKSITKYGVVCMMTTLALFYLPTYFGK